MLTRLDFSRLATAAQTDPRPLIEGAFAIQTKQLPGQAPVQRLVLNRAQAKVHDAMLAQRRAGQPGRVIVLKARQPGISTLGCGYMLSTGLTTPYGHGMIVTHLEEASAKLFQKIEFMVQRLPPELSPRRKTARREQMVFDFMPCSDGDVKLETSITVATASGGELWRGVTLQTVHLSEFAYFPRPEQTLLGILQAVPLHEKTLVVIESTANGMGDAFHQEWLRAESGESSFAPVFIPWWDIDEYKMACPADFELEPDEKEMKKAMGLSNEQLQWRRYVLYTQCRGSEDLFNQEYPANPAVAFLVTGRPAFPMKILQECYDSAQKVVPEFGEIGLENHQFYKARRGRLKVWKRPEKDHDYTIGGDPAAGMPDGDYTCAQVFDRMTGEQVACWHGHLAPVPFAQVLIALGHWYNTAILAPELTGGHGFAVVEELKMHQYPRIYVWQRVDKVRHGMTNFYGWETSHRTRPLLIDTFNQAITESEVHLRDPDTIMEFLQFQYLDRTHAAGLDHDDRAMAMMIAYRVHIEMPMPGTGMPPRVRWEGPAVKNSPTIPIPQGSMNQTAWKGVDEDLAQMGRMKTGFIDYANMDPDDVLDADAFEPDIPW